MLTIIIGLELDLPLRQVLAYSLVSVRELEQVCPTASEWVLA